jgi:GT2 family glycosyltransferase/glycosyltransferase involved in cell wall biosynthesis/cyclopropane fatty-acyl-phospholipid synthase-like methyltransferase
MAVTDASQLYDAYYYAHGCGKVPCERNAIWLQYFGSLADHIVREIQPATVLDAGCAIGLLVEMLRERGVEASGIDISEYAIRQVYAPMRPYCTVGSIVEPFSQRYDLIVTIEVLEHLPADQAEVAIANFCRFTDEVLFSSSPFDYKEATHLNTQPPEYWAELFARQGFYRDVDFDGSFLTPWAVLFRKGRGPVTRIVAAYERRSWQLRQENMARRDMNLEQRNELAAKDQKLQQLTERVEQQDAIVMRYEQLAQSLRERVAQQDHDLASWAARWASVENSLGGRVMKGMQNVRSFIAPPRSLRDQILDNALQRLVLNKRTSRVKATSLAIEPVTPRSALTVHQATVDIIVCVHNALDDVQRCLESVIEQTTPPYSIILIDDGSAAPTRDFLKQFATDQGATLTGHEEALGYGRAANVGLRQSSADFVVLLNSDTIVTAGWLDRLVGCAESNPQYGLVGPLSNTASWQSIPEIEHQGDWAENPLPEGVDVQEMGRQIAQYSARLYPTLPFLNGFCYMIRREVIEQIGYFDEENFGVGYGEEDDFTLRARQAGWLVAIADDTYVYHAQSRSYSNEKRQRLSQQAGQRLAQKHGQAKIDEGVAASQYNRVLAGVRARSRAMFERQSIIEQGRARFTGRRVLFVLPINGPGGGGNVIIDESSCMQQMGVEVNLFNLTKYRAGFEQAYPNLDLPVIYGTVADLTVVARGYDAVIATHNISVEWLASSARPNGRPVLGYYVQGFEPYMYAPDSAEYQHALKSYTRLPDLVRFTKTEWTRQEVKKHTKADCDLIGVSLNIDLFRPRPPIGLAWPDRPLRVAAMVRPAAPYREPKLTMELLRQMVKTYGQRVEAVIFGTVADDPDLAALPSDFKYTHTGELNQQQVARLMNEVDIFVDYSSHQAMGLTALEAMACGAAVIVPAHGGAVSFAVHGQNSLVVETASRAECWQAMQRLIEDHDFRRRLQFQGLQDVCQFYPERPAFNILNTLFKTETA